MPWWMIFGIAGVAGAGLLFGIEAAQGQHAGRIETWFGMVALANRPALFRYVVVMRWLAAALAFAGAAILILMPYIISD
jgi:hypothetical protein